MSIKRMSRKLKVRPRSVQILVRHFLGCFRTSRGEPTLTLPLILQLSLLVGLKVRKHLSLMIETLISRTSMSKSDVRRGPRESQSKKRIRSSTQIKPFALPPWGPKEFKGCLGADSHLHYSREQLAVQHHEINPIHLEPTSSIIG
jgi:hypothetical protein